MVVHWLQLYFIGILLLIIYFSIPYLSSHRLTPQGDIVVCLLKVVTLPQMLKSRAVKITKDSNHPGNRLFILLPSGKAQFILLRRTYAIAYAETHRPAP